MSDRNNTLVTIIIPVKNEEGNIIKVLQSIKAKVKFPVKVIIVDGRSTDHTYDLVKKYSKKNKNVTIVKTSPEKSAFKESLEEGIRLAKTGFVATMMGDLSDDPTTLNKMYKEVKKGADVVIGSRYTKGGGIVGKPKLQRAISWSVSKTLSFLTGIPIHDLSNPYTIYRRNLLNQMDTVSRTNELPIEMVFKAYFSGAKITEIPTVWRGRKAGKSKFKILKIVPGFTKLYIWVVINSWIFNLQRLFGSHK